MARAVFSIAVRRASSILKSSPSKPLFLRSGFPTREPIFFPPEHLPLPIPPNSSWVFRNLSHGTVNLVISQGKPKFEMHEIDPPKKEKWKTKKRFKLQRMREKQERKAANRKDPRRLGIKRKKKRQKFATAEERIKYKLEKARIKEALLIERLKRYEVPKVQGPEVKPDDLTGEERFYMKKMAQKKSNYAPIGKRGIFGGVILNMHMHWKKHETVKVICKPCKPGQVQEYAQEIARLSGGIPIQINGDDTIVFYRGKNYAQPKVMSPVNTLSKKKALEKFKYEQSLESVRHFIAIAEKELELYYRHIALYGDPNDRNPLSILDSPTEETKESGNLKILRKQKLDSTSGFFSAALSGTEADSSNSELSETDGSEHDNLSLSESDSEDDKIYSSADDEASTTKTQLFDFKHERLECRQENLI
ncbi:uncharacterized CRM domain-containing protein At3g25440, chloroplastic [Prunus avium]|uniref:Uncharacterized CRM domain-containing protein At3g25440, chloroplastic n=1 Tax=Prunus avium TaxID=42229 RepID=A0A6P5RFR2_PRUAV|nr:uncharacterized CRM domain-containing protein At3g25440, chloroplastic [Prunus avium]